MFGIFVNICYLYFFLPLPVSRGIDIEIFSSSATPPLRGTFHNARIVATSADDAKRRQIVAGSRAQFFLLLYTRACVDYNKWIYDPGNPDVWPFIGYAGPVTFEWKWSKGDARVFTLRRADLIRCDALGKCVLVFVWEVSRFHFVFCLTVELMFMVKFKLLISDTLVWSYSVFESIMEFFWKLMV